MSSLKPCRIDPWKINWNIYDEAQHSEINAYIRENLTETEINEIDLRLLGNIVLAQSKALSIAVNRELLEPISKWSGDPDWMQRFKVQDEQCYDWASYKRKQRKWTIQQKRLAAERLKLFRQEIIRKRNFRKELSRIMGRSNPKEGSCIPLNKDFIEQIVAPFNSSEQRRQEACRQFGRALSCPGHACVLVNARTRWGLCPVLARPGASKRQAVASPNGSPMLVLMLCWWC